MTRSSGGIGTSLRNRLGSGKVLDDPPSLRAYAIDASIHKVSPSAVVLLESAKDLRDSILFANENGIPLTARSGGTNLTGNAIGSGIILEFSKLNKILELNQEERWVRVQPGINYAELNRHLFPWKLRFAPDPSSGEMCKLGGMIGNNAAGPHTLKYGATKDHIKSLKLLLASGEEMIAAPLRLESQEFSHLQSQFTWVTPLIELLQTHSELLKRKKPRVSKNSSGFNLFDLVEGLEQGILDLPKLWVGSEGTLGLTLEASLNLLPHPKRTATALVHLQRLDDVGAIVADLLTLQPSAMELLDSNSLDLIGRGRYKIPDSTQAVLLVELDEEPLEDHIDSLFRISKNYKTTRPLEIARGEKEQQALWEVRKAIYPTLYRYGDPQKKPINFADDVVVPVEKLPELIHYLDHLFRDLNVPVAIYGHVGDGNAHVNPLLDINETSDFEKLIQLAKSIHETVIDRFGGSICGEHGDGRVRGEFVKTLYGEEVYQLFWKVKNLLDPKGLLNPDVKLTDQPFTTTIDHERLSKACATCGRCNSVCPVYDVRKEESNSARGWFHILTDPDYSYEKASRVVEACLNCKSCGIVCPAGIDVSSIILDKRAERPNPLAGFVFKVHAKPRIFDWVIKCLGRSQSLWDRPLPRKLLDFASRPILRFIAPSARIHQNLILPRLVSRTLRERFSHLTEEAGHVSTTAYFHGCAANYFEDGVGDSTIRVLSRLGIDVSLPPQRCSGTPVETYGHRELAAQHARYNIKSLKKFNQVITSCASCTHMLKNYSHFFRAEDRQEANELASKVMHITEYLWKQGESPIIGSSEPQRTIAYHASCHLRAAGVREAPVEILRRLPGTRFVEMASSDRCAGGAGTYLVKDWELSQQIFERKRRSVLESGADTVATSCPACMIQLRNGLDLNIEVKHVIHLVDEATETISDNSAPSRKFPH